MLLSTLLLLLLLLLGVACQHLLFRAAVRLRARLRASSRRDIFWRFGCLGGVDVTGPKVVTQLLLSERELTAMCCSPSFSSSSGGRPSISFSSFAS